jgi:hypothetical protein
MVHVKLKSTEIDKEEAHRQHRFVWEKKPAEGSPEDARALCHLQTGGSIGKEGHGKG